MFRNRSDFDKITYNAFQLKKFTCQIKLILHIAYHMTSILVACFRICILFLDRRRFHSCQHNYVVCQKIK